MIIYGSPFRYYQGFGILDQLGGIMADMGNSFFIVGDSVIREVVGEAMTSSLSQAGKTVIWDNFQGECSDTEINRLEAIYRRNQCNMILGVGGGKAMDAAKALSIRLGNAPVTLIPTIAASDAPVSHVSIIYRDDHSKERVDHMPYSPWIILVDTKVILNAPPKFLAAGIADAAATKFEAEACMASGALNFLKGRQPRMTGAVCDLCWQIVREHGLAAVEAVKNKTHSQAFEDVVEAATLLSGIGFEIGGLAAGHATASGLTNLSGALQSSHGEMVAFGLLVHFVLEKRPLEFVREFADFFKLLGLPTTLAGLGVDVRQDQAEIKAMVHKVCTPPNIIFNMPMPINAEIYERAVYQADEWGR